MKIVKELFLVLLLSLLFGISVKAKTFYTVVDSYTEAKQLSPEHLISYKNGVAVYDAKVDNRLEEDYSMEFSNLNNEYNFQTDKFKEIEFENVYRNNITGKDTVVAIIDGGCEINHPDLKDNIIGYYNVADEDTPFDVSDDDGHGTAVAGVIAASDNNIGIVGVAPDAKLYIIKACKKDHFFLKYSDIIKAINKAISLGYVNVINMSFNGTIYSKYLEEAVKNARNHGILVVCAAGNESSAKPNYPAAFQIGLSVGSSYSGELASFSNYGVNINIVAPSSAYSTAWGNRYQFHSGTSFSTPYVSGAAALIYGYYKNIPRNEFGADYVKNLILDNTDGKAYGTARGKLNLQNIFKPTYISSPNKPKLIIKEDSRTYQQIITVKSKNNIDIYYSINGAVNNTKLDKKLRLDKRGTYNISFVAVKKGTRAYSKVLKEKIIVSKNVYSQNYLNSIELSAKQKMKKGTSQKIKIKISGKRIDRTRIKWISSNSKIAKIDENGTITVADNAPRGKKVKFTAKIGSIKKVISITIR